MIRDYIGMYPPLVVLGETRRLIEYHRNNVSECSVRFNLEKPLYANKILFQGVSYLSKLSHEPFPSAELLSQPARTTKITLSKDHMGIRNIRFSDAASEVSNDRAEWYETMKLPRLFSHPHIKIRLNVR
jgi:hypothetical protein